LAGDNRIKMKIFHLAKNRIIYNNYLIKKGYNKFCEGKI